MGAKRESKIDTFTPAPGSYNVTNATVRPRSPETNFKSQAGRKDANIDRSGGPGSYFVPTQSDSKPMTIGVKRTDRVEITPGPGDYRPETA